MNNSVNDEKRAENTEAILTSIEDSGSICTKNNGITIQCVSIIGQVEGHYLLPDNQKTTKYEHLLPLLYEIEQNEEVHGMLLLLNTVGGDVEAGLAIAEMIAGMKKPTVSLVIGGGHSIGVPLAVCTSYSFIVPSATMTVHPVRITGTVLGAPQSYLYFQKMQDRISDFIVSHSRCSKESFDSLLFQRKDMATDLGTVLEGEDAVKIGLIDSVGGLCSALEKLRELIKE